MGKDLKHNVILNAPPLAVFEALMDERRHRQFTGSPAKISRQPGGAFTCYGGYIKGFNLEIIAPKLIVQAWRSRDWPRETYSVVTFKLAKGAGGKTKLSFTHVGIPAKDYPSKNKGWRTHYWEPLGRYLETAA